MRLHGSSHLTDDFDITYARDNDNLIAISQAFREHRPRLRGAPDDLPFIWDERTLRYGLNFTLATNIGDIDILGEVAGSESFDGLWERSIKMEIEAEVVHVVSINDLIKMKRAANRPKDQAHLLELLALQNLISTEVSE